MIQIKSPDNLIAYFSMEIGIDPEIPTYAGGLGILAGDVLRSFADLNVSAIGVTLLSEAGYFTQEIGDDRNNHQQIERYHPWPIDRYLERLPQEVIVHADHRDIYLHLWRYIVTGIEKSQVPIIFLDSRHEKNTNEHRKLTQKLYPHNLTFRFLQEVILGIGGMKALTALGYQPTVYHLNEGHSSLLVIEQLHQLHDQKIDGDDACRIVADRTVFTTHTPVAAGHDRFPMSLVQDKLSDHDFAHLQSVPAAIEPNGHPNQLDLNMTQLGLAMSNKINGVARRHAAISETMFPQYTFETITNGVHHTFWTSPSFYALYDEYVPGWAIEPFNLLGVSNIPSDQIGRAHHENKRRLIEFIRQFHDPEFDEETLTIGYARRFTKYKRPDLIFYDLERLKAIAAQHPIQLVFAGKAHPDDIVGKSLLSEIVALKNKLGDRIRLVFIPNYNIKLAKLIIPGVDLWLNTPMRPYEASGTSGMKASLNGVPNMSVLDGWWLEGHMRNVTGWEIGPNPITRKDFELVSIDSDDATDLYDKLEQKILPMYYEDRQQYNRIRRNSIALHGSYFNSHRVVQQYILKSYLT